MHPHFLATSRNQLLSVRADRSDLRELNDANFSRFDAKLEQRLAQFETKLEQRMAGLESKLVRWMFVFWIGQAATTVGLVLAVVRLR